jgi:hypothetical protein
MVKDEGNKKSNVFCNYLNNSGFLTEGKAYKH